MPNGNGPMLQAVTLVNTPNKDLLTLTRDIDPVPRVSWDAEWARMLTSTPNWKP